MRVRGLRPRTFSAKRRTQTPGESAAFARTAAQLRGRLEDLPIICTSIYPPTEESCALSPVAHLIKPFRLRELEVAIVSALAL